MMRKIVIPYHTHTHTHNTYIHTHTHSHTHTSKEQAKKNRAMEFTLESTYAIRRKRVGPIMPIHAGTYTPRKDPSFAYAIQTMSKAPTLDAMAICWQIMEKTVCGINPYLAVEEVVQERPLFH
jgi:hypothetical protein